MLFDAHAHLDMLDEHALTGALDNARSAGVHTIVSCATSFASNEKNLALASQHPSIFAAIGLYPLDALELSPQEIERAFAFFETEINHARAIGEVGLDFKYSTSQTDQQKQEALFIRFIQLSKKYDKPLIIHSRFAQRRVLELLEEHNAHKVLLHSFVDSSKLMLRAAKNKYFVSVGLRVLTNPDIQKNIGSFPLENLLFETDAPIRFDGEEALPQKVPLIAEKVAQLKNMASAEVETQQEKNFRTLFG